MAVLAAACGSPPSRTEVAQSEPRTASVEIEPITLPYPTVAAARQALAARSDVRTRMEDGWTVIEVPAEHATWRFVPQNYLSYPALMMRRLVVRDGVVTVQYAVLCQGEPAACQDLRQGVEQQNRSIRAQLEPGAHG